MNKVKITISEKQYKKLLGLFSARIRKKLGPIKIRHMGLNKVKTRIALTLNVSILNIIKIISEEKKIKPTSRSGISIRNIAITPPAELEYEGITKEEVKEILKKISPDFIRNVTIEVEEAEPDVDKELLARAREIVDEPEKKPAKKKAPKKKAAKKPTKKEIEEAAEPEEPSKDEVIGIEPGTLYIVHEKTAKSVFSVWRQLFERLENGYILTRFQKKKVSKLGIDEENILRITDEPEEGEVGKNLNVLLTQLAEVLEEAPTVLALQGLEYLIDKNDTSTTIEFLKRLNEMVSDTESIILISASTKSEKEVEVVGPLEREGTEILVSDKIEISKKIKAGEKKGVTEFDHLELGKTYIFIEKSPEKSIKLLAGAIKRYGLPGKILYSQLNQVDKTTIMSLLGAEGVELEGRAIYMIANEQGKGLIHQKDTATIFHRITEDFIDENEKGAILLDIRRAAAGKRAGRVLKGIKRVLKRIKGKDFILVITSNKEDDVIKEMIEGRMGIKL